MSDTATETPTTDQPDHRTPPRVTISLHTSGEHHLPLNVVATQLPTCIMLDLGPVCVFLDDAAALADLHQRIGRQLVELGRGEVRS